MRAIDGDTLDDFLASAEIEAINKKKYVLAGALNTIRGNLRNFPSAQPEQGEWIRGDAEKLTGKWRCSICGNTIYSETKRDREKFHAFCGHCGAKMN